MKQKQVRQGDVLAERVQTKPEIKTKPQKDAILAHGEATGHAHTIEDSDSASVSEALEPWTNSTDLDDAAPMSRKFLALSKDSGVIHQEHSRIPLEKGMYRVTRQREYSPESIRNVAD